MTQDDLARLVVNLSEQLQKMQHHAELRRKRLRRIRWYATGLSIAYGFVAIAGGVATFVSGSIPETLAFVVAIGPLSILNLLLADPVDA